MIPFSKLMIYEYHRLIKTTHLSLHEILERVGQFFDIVPSGNLPIQPLHKGEFGLYAKGKSWQLELKSEYKPTGLLESLDVSVVEHFLL
jgi:uncharacterized protein (DUF1015 family)